MTSKRHKAFIGAIIGTTANVIGGAIKNKKQRKAAEKQRALEQAQQVRTETYQQANALQQMLNSSAIEQEFANRMTLKAGGKTNMIELNIIKNMLVVVEVKRILELQFQIF